MERHPTASSIAEGGVRALNGMVPLLSTNHTARLSVVAVGEL